jgi:hypothetical protein
LLWDHAYPVAQAQTLLVYGEWPALGQVTTFFINNGPMQAYVVLLPLLVFGSWWCIFWFGTTLNVLAVPLIYRLLRDVAGEPEAVAGSLLYAAGPWVVHFGRATWAGGLTPVAGALILALLLPALAGPGRRKRGLRIFGAFVALAVYAQSYLLGFIITPVQVGLLLVLRRRQVQRRAFVAGLLVFAAAAGVYVYTLARDAQAQGIRVDRFGQAAEGPLSLRSGPLYLAVLYVTGLDFQTEPVPVEARPAALAALARAANLGAGALLALGLGRALLGALRRKPEAWLDVALATWWLVPVAALSFSFRDPYPWHALTSLPAGHLLAARGAGWLWREARPLRSLLLAAGLVVAATWLAQLEVERRFRAEHPIAPNVMDLDRLTLDASLQVGAELRQLSADHATQHVFALLPAPDAAAWSLRPLETTTWFDDPNLLIFPLDQAAIYVRPGRGAPPTPYALAQRETVLAFPPDDYVAYDVFPARTRQQVLDLLQVVVDWPSDTGRSLLGYSAAGDWRAGQVTRLTTFWAIESLPEGYTNGLYGPYAHLNAPDGRTVANVGAQALEGYYHRLGHVYVQPLEVTVPAGSAPGKYELELGLYDGVHQAGTQFYSPLGQRPFYTTTVAIGE